MVSDSIEKRENTLDPIITTAAPNAEPCPNVIPG
jgi:hypothetical protein